MITAFIAPKQGLVVRGIRKITFLMECQQENILKALWKCASSEDRSWVSEDEFCAVCQQRWFFRIVLVHLMKRRGWLRHVADRYELTASGMLQGRKLVRLHRLWELYLVEVCKVAKDRVHPLAEEMEHILTEEMESELRLVLQDPVMDPHQAPIPPYLDAERRRP